VKFNHLSILLSIAALLLSSNLALAASGSCEGYKFEMQRDGKSINTSWPLRVLRQDAPVYSNQSGSSQKTRLKFGKVLDAVGISNSPKSGRVLITKTGSMPGESLGWMDRQDLLCNITPIKNDKGLERKAFIKTPPEPEIEGNVAGKGSVPAYACYEGSCRTNMSLTRFNMYFIVAEKNQRYLLAEEYNLIDGPPLIGWVEEDKIIPWNTTLQVRPKEEVTRNIVGSTSLGSSNDSGVVLTGGKIWYKFPLHAPLLDKTGGKYHIAAPGIGMSGFDVKGIDEETSLVEQHKNVDVLFLLDGTKSMQPYLDTAKSFASQLMQELSDKHEFRETHFRFGFRVYRDNFAGNQGIGEGLPLSGSCEARAALTAENKKEFNRRIQPVKQSNETSREDSTYTENLFIGIRQAIKDLASCPDRLKVLVVIADHGDNNQQVSNSLIRKLTRTFTHSPRLFFIQTPKEKSNVRYNKAYKRFKTQAKYIFSQVYPGMDYGDNLSQLSKGSPQRIINDLTALVVQQIGNYSSSAVVNETMQKIRAGQSIQTIVERGMKEGDLPVLYWQLMEKDLCKQFGDQCKHPVDHRVIDAYIPISDDIVEEIWMGNRDMDNWKSLLRPLNENLIKNKGFTQQKKEFIRVLKEELIRIIGEPLFKDSGEALAEILKRKAGLPVREHSPLMQYTVAEISNMQQCEFRRLIKWTTSVYDILNRVTASPKLKVTYSLEDFPNSQCPRVSAKGRNIKRMTLKGARPLGPDDNHSYLHNFRKGQAIYSIPMDFLP